MRPINNNFAVQRTAPPTTAMRALQRFSSLRYGMAHLLRTFRDINRWTATSYSFLHGTSLNTKSYVMYMVPVGCTNVAEMNKFNVLFRLGKKGTDLFSVLSQADVLFSESKCFLS